MAKNKKREELLESLIQNAWMLSDEEIQKIMPGQLDNAISLLDQGELVYTPFKNKTNFDVENPDIHLINVLRNPNFFQFTCSTLFNKPDGGGTLELLPLQQLCLMELWHRQFPMMVASRGFGKTFLLGLYALLRITFCPGSKVVIVSSGFRQAKMVFEVMEKLWHNSPLFRDMIGVTKGAKGRDNGPRRDIDRCEFIIGDSIATALPIGNGEKIRGLRSNFILTDEFASINEEIYSTVIQGFGSVSADPVQNVKDIARKRVLQRLGLWNRDMDIEELNRVRGNQSVLAGTAYYSFNHFCRYHKEYKSIINSKGDKDKLEELFKGPVPDAFNWRDYSIIRIPYNFIPEGYMDAKTLARAQQTTSKSIFNMEYKTIFQNDSEGFFKRTLIEKCVVGKTDDPNPPSFDSAGGTVLFNAKIIGDRQKQYIYGVDPASESDKFAITIIELHEDHRRVVFCWTTVKSDHREKVKQGRVKEHDFFRYCVRKIRDLMLTFPCQILMIDAGGGGITLREAFRDKDKLNPGEQPIYEIIEENKPKDTDDMPGLHLIQLVHFRDNNWVKQANYGLKKDMEDRILLFPQIDSLAIGLAMEEDKETGRIIVGEQGEKISQTADTLESCMFEIEELKNELSTIVVTVTKTGVEHFDTPDADSSLKTKKGRMRKDRYSSLLMANMAARQISLIDNSTKYEGIGGGFVGNIDYQNGKPSVIGNQSYANSLSQFENYGRIIFR